MSKKLKSKKIIITGGSLGIGLAVAKECALNGADVIIAARNKSDLDKAKDEINKLFIEILEQIKKLYNKHDNAFSYFINQSQTHYYGAKISQGENRADIHGSLLCLWAVLMILESLDLKEEKLKIIKP